MKPIGGYFELECGKIPPYYTDGIYLNSCRNGIKYLIRTLGISEIHVPYYTCDVVFQAILQEGCKMKKYHLDENLMPARGFKTCDFIIYNNYFGVSGEKIKELANLYPNLIVDNAQSFYSTPNCRATIYSPRKFFGLPDGGILRGRDIPILNLPTGTSYKLCSHLLKRIDLGPQAAYNDFVLDDKALEEYPLEQMSILTRALMGNIDYETIKSQRIKNFEFLEDSLHTIFPISLSNDDVPMVYPYITNDSHLRDKLISNNIFVATYWPNVLKSCNRNSAEYHFAKNIIPLPIDQRYGEEDMKIICNLINK